MSEPSLRLLPRAYSLRDEKGSARAVTLGDALRQYGRSVNFVGDKRRTLHALFEGTHLLMAVPTVWFFVDYASVETMLLFFGIFLFLSNFVNTVWYHRYCSHRAFQFRSLWLPRLLLWLNPLGYREEVYALVHHVHHSHPDEDIDPNGPRLGWLGNYIASYFEIDTEVTEEQYRQIKSRIAHVGMPFASYESFRRWGCVELVPHYLARWACASLLWIAVWYALGGVPFVMAWFAVQFCWHAAVRDFNFHGHGTTEKPGQVDGWDLDRSTLARNLRFYGFLAGEWHNNHHAFRASANTAFLPGQVDVPFQIIRLMRACGLVVRYHDHRSEFLRRHGARLPGAREAVGGSAPAS